MPPHPFRLKTLAYLARESLSVAEYNVLCFAHYGSHPPRTMIRFAHRESIGWPIRPPSSRAACRGAAASLMAKGLLQIIDDAALLRIEAEMAANPAFGPFRGLPEFGDLDFAKAGAILWRRIVRELFEQDESKHWTGQGDADSMEFIATSESILREQISHDLRYSGREVISVSDITAIGPWRDHWWDDIFEQGFRATLTYRPEPEDT